MSVNETIVFWLIRKSRVLARLAAIFALFRKHNYLTVSGWNESFHHGLPQDSSGNPLPWYTYAAIDFLEGRTRPDMRVFEYGSGNSTLWWGSRTEQVVACEHDKAWYDRMVSVLPANVPALPCTFSAGATCGPVWYGRWSRS